HAQDKPKSIPKAPPRSDGEGPFDRLILRGATLIDGTGSPPVGPVDIVVEENRIVNIKSVGHPGVPIDPEKRPEAREGDKELDVEGMYVLPGFVDMHGHIGGVAQGTPAEYVLKLWMGHGITTIRDPGSGNGLDWVLEHKEKSNRNEITAPRIEAYIAFGRGSEEPIATPEQARRWVQEVARKGADGLKIFALSLELMAATLDEARKQGLRSASHHPQLSVARVNVLQTARMGLTTMEHWYGLAEALFTDRTVQDFPLDYNYNNEQHRFGEAGRLWKQAAAPFSDHWNAVMKELIELDFTIDPTMTIYEATRDFMRVRRAEWHEEYTLPSLWDFFCPNRKAHGSFWFYWTTENEIDWKENFKLWMTFLNEYKNRGGRVTVGSDAGYIYKIYGFGYIRELELLREAGFHPLEVIRAATLHGAEALGLADQIGSAEIGKFADFVVVEENPLQNLKVLYGTGAIKLNENNEPVRVGGVKYTIKDGIIFDAKQLLADVRQIVKKAKEEEGKKIEQPGITDSF
ncbi:amidohydrolase family protein, partial [candidate division KSB1 bacterium]|nr:amidohydrolase family protein [candidate division KSB1 bacterium]NIR70487.1 amidohydrolase family protein [candidate division KSB1 bacterium]NIS27662.1 amidohydrolase family protein [candidate division KSB1 bacterium]NIT74497.1 amidohydrolase family protein [candidate division KSB1 bacterium]NIU23736.1 amidohydrolase family protein [candidate division KSB1 bacterium]